MTENKNRSVLKAGIWYTLTNYLSKGAVYLTIPIFSALMSKTEIGKYMNINAWLQILLPLLTLEYCSSLNLARFDYKDDFSSYVTSTLLYGTIFTLSVSIIFLAFSDFFEAFFNIEHYVLIIIILYLLVYPAFQFYQNICMFRYDYKKVALITIINLLLPLFLSLFFALSWEDRLKGRIVGFYVPTIIVCAVLYFFFLYKSHDFSLKYFRYSLKISFPLIWHTLAIHMLASGDRIVITKTLGDEKNALYTIAYTVCGMITILWSSMNSAWSPWCTECMHRDDVELVKRRSKPYILFFSSIMVVALLLAPEILFIMGAGKNYYEARFVIPPILIGLIAQFVYSLYVNVEFYNKMQLRISFGTIFAAAINLFLNYLFVPKYGYIAAGYTTLAGYLCLLIYHFISVKYSKLSHWYDNRFNFAVVGIFIILLPFVVFLYNHQILRYILLAIYILALGFICFLNRKNLLMIIKNFRN